MGNRVYGLPYQGSKNQIARELISILPPARTFYDVFAGGGAMTHAALQSGKYERVVMNDISDSVIIFRDAILGKYVHEDRWISKEDFTRLKDEDPLVRLVWSFGCNNRHYMYNPDREKFKRNLHYSIYFGSTDVPESLMEMTPKMKALYRSKSPDERLEILRNIIRRKGLDAKQDDLEYMQLEEKRRIDRINALSCLHKYYDKGNLIILQGDYHDLPLTDDDAVIYCDPPYKNTKGYICGGNFDHEEFYSWCKMRRQFVFISEYNMPAEFKCLYEIRKRALFSPSGTSKSVPERIFAPERTASFFKLTLFNMEYERLRL